jgi:AcrR family transcriptional regulator
MNMKDFNVREELLNTAFKLFFEKGYDNTSVNAIIKVVGVTKGAFYHYFESKEDLLTEISVRYATKQVQFIEDTRKRKDLSGLEKLNKIIHQMYVYKIENKENRSMMFEIQQSNSNVLLQKRISEIICDLAKKEYSLIISEGVAQGDFHTVHTDEAGAFLMNLAILLNQEISKYVFKTEKTKEDKEQIIKTLEFYEEVYNGVLGAQPGSVELYQIAKHYIESI